VENVVSYVLALYHFLVFPKPYLLGTV